MKVIFQGLLMVSMCVSSATAGPILQTFVPGTPLDVMGSPGSGQVLTLGAEGLAYGEETPDGDWGNWGTLEPEGVLDAVFMGLAENENGVWIAWRNETQLTIGQLEGLNVTALVDAQLFSLESMDVVRSDAGDSWIKVGSDALFHFAGGVLTDLSPLPFPMDEIGSLGGSSLLIAGSTDGLVQAASWTSAGGWEPSEEVGPGSVKHVCRSGDHVTYLVADQEEGTGVWSWTPEEGWVVGVAPMEGSTPQCMDTGLGWTQISENGEFSIVDGQSGDVVGVIGTNVLTAGPSFPGADSLLLSAVSTAGDVKVGRLTLGGDTGPAIAGTRPDPALAGDAVELLGFHLMEPSTAIALDGTTVFSSGDSSWSVQFFLDEELPGGEHTVTVNTNQGEDSAVIQVLAVPPQIDAVNPDPISLGELVVVEGKHLEQVTQVTVGDSVQEITSVDLGAVVFLMDTETAPGSMNLEVLSPTGTANILVSVVTPPPVMVKAFPSPVKVGQFLTIEGQFFDDVSLITLGGVSEEVVAQDEGSVTVYVGELTPVGPQTLMMTAVGGASPPFGPLSVLPMAQDAPVLTGWLPSSVSPGLDVLVQGERLDGLSKVTVNGVEAEWLTEGKTERRLRIPEGLEEGEAILFLHGEETVLRSQLTILKEGLPSPEMTELNMEHAAWGETLTITGTGLSGVWSVFIGKTSHDVVSATSEQVEIVVDDSTVGGPQRVFAVGAGVSNEFEVFIGVKEEDQPDVVDDASSPGEDVGEEASSEDSVNSDTVNDGEAPDLVASSGGGDGCTTETPRTGLAGLFAFLFLGVLVLRQDWRKGER